MNRGRFWWVSGLFIAVILSSCGKQNCIEAEGGRFEDVRYFENFHTFVLDIPGEVEIWSDTNLSSSRVEVVAQKEVIENLLTGISSGVVSASFSRCFKSHNEITFRLYVNSLQKVVVNQSGRVKTLNRLTGEQFTLELNQSTTADMVVNIDSIHTILGNASLCTYHGYASKSSHQLLAAGSVSAGDLITDTTYVDIKGTGSVTCYAIGLLDATVNGLGSVSVFGSDTLTIEEELLNGGQLFDMR